MSELLLINPPVAKPSEAPAGIARLAGTLKMNGFPCHLLDASLEGILFLLKSPTNAHDTWSKRAIRNCRANLDAIRSPEIYQNHDRYRRAVSDLNRLLENTGRERGILLSLSNYQDQELSPLESTDLLKASAEHENNIYYSYFSNRLPEIISSISPEIIGFSLNYLSQALTTFAMAGFLKSNFPDIRIICGGGLVTSWLSNHNWKNPFGDLIDHLIAGPGEKPLLELLGKNNDLAGHPPDYTGLPFDN